MAIAAPDKVRATLEGVTHLLKGLFLRNAFKIRKPQKKRVQNLRKSDKKNVSCRKREMICSIAGQRKAHEQD